MPSSRYGLCHGASRLERTFPSSVTNRTVSVTMSYGSPVKLRPAIDPSACVIRVRGLSMPRCRSRWNAARAAGWPARRST